MKPSLPQSVLALPILVGLVALQQLFALPGGSALLRAMQDSLHAPWFFVIVVVLCWWFRERRPVARFVLVFCVAALVAVGTELAQLYVASRSASGGDLLRNAVGGALGFVFAQAVLESDRSKGVLRLTPGRLSIAALALVALTAFSAWLPWQELELRRYRAALAPQVFDLTDERTRRFVSVNEGGLLAFGTADARWPDYEGRPVMRITFGDSEYPTFYVSEVMQRWAAFDTVALDVFVLGTDDLPLTLAVQYEGSAGTSAFVESVLPPGGHQIKIPRSRFVPDDADQLRVRDVLIYTQEAHAGRALLLGALTLQ